MGISGFLSSDPVSGSGEEQKEKAMEELNRLREYQQIRLWIHLSTSAVFPGASAGS